MPSSCYSRMGVDDWMCNGCAGVDECKGQILTDLTGCCSTTPNTGGRRKGAEVKPVMLRAGTDMMCTFYSCYSNKKSAHSITGSGGTCLKPHSRCCAYACPSPADAMKILTTCEPQDSNVGSGAILDACSYCEFLIVCSIRVRLTIQ